MQEYELCHYGVKGMKWGVRRARSDRNYMNRKQARAAYDDMDRKKAQYKIAKKDYDHSFKNAYRKSSDAWSISKTRRLANDERWDDAFKKEASMQKAKAAYKAAKKNIRDNATVGQKIERGSKKAVVVMASIGSLYLTDKMYFGGEGSKAVKKGATYAKNALMDKMFNSSVIDATGKVIGRFNL